MSKGWDFRSFNERYCSDAIILSLPSVRVILQQCHHSVLALSGGECGPNGCWLLAAGYWLLVAGYWLLVAGCWLPWTGGWCKDHWLLVVGCLGPLAVDWWLATVDWTMV